MNLWFPGTMSITTMLIEDKACGTQLMRGELIAEGRHGVTKHQPTTDKIMRLHAQTASIENGFVHIPETVAWLVFLAKEDKQRRKALLLIMGASPWLRQNPVSQVKLCVGSIGENTDRASNRVDNARAGCTAEQIAREIYGLPVDVVHGFYATRRTQTSDRHRRAYAPHGRVYRGCAGHHRPRRARRRRSPGVDRASASCNPSN